ncbi:MAG: FliI/YscN family ATPase [Deltaproteobacteria bacterium]|nr:FliI/YscN family ATPase [Deltaproteobacteria bacterium]
MSRFGALDLERVRARISEAPVTSVSGRVVRAGGLAIEALLPAISVGAACEIELPNGRLLAECVGFNGERAILVPIGDVRGLRGGAAVFPIEHALAVPVSDALLGRVVSPTMEPIDGRGEPALERRALAQLHAQPPNPMARRRISQPFVTGVRTIDALLTCGAGQRVGIMAGAGVGKSVLLGMLARHCEADVIVVGLIGERGREVREFVERDLGEQGLARSIVIVATGDRPPLERVHAALAATAVAEHYRSEGKRVLLLMDSLTRVAMALREIGLAAEEPPTSKGYPPSVFAALPKLVERAGNDEGPGGITAFYTVLVEGDDLADPVADCARAALDGHIVLSRKLAGAGHFPAIDVLESVSRVMLDVTTVQQRASAARARDALAALRESADLIDIGAYQAGSNRRVDFALSVQEQLRTFARQQPEHGSSYDDTRAQLDQALVPPRAPRSAHA